MLDAFLFDSVRFRQLAFFLTDRSIGVQTREPHLPGAVVRAPGSETFQTMPQERGYSACPCYECIRHQ